MKLTITMDLDNSAFEFMGSDEVHRILSDLCARLPEPLSCTSGAINLRDVNGNWVGEARIEEARA